MSFDPLALPIHLPAQEIPLPEGESPEAILVQVVQAIRADTLAERIDAALLWALGEGMLVTLVGVEVRDGVMPVSSGAMPLLWCEADQATPLLENPKVMARLRREYEAVAMLEGRKGDNPYGDSEEGCGCSVPV
ncbi:MAG: hypothetical protein COX57_06650 [Alphaproteobacteria bacterium CG_4_10_14_0_2_um_filter_63_37]|nr:MAG: hypothetical protein AUJ55_00115 [Proteobacteria bacterium CG1_02_64_396]PJA24802.1 MAG: hypothetical protein COX57_06650 [Alphaproteobacteria bacterium CG_4_10_14_0_2_um_filter_63_37]